MKNSPAPHPDSTMPRRAYSYSRVSDTSQVKGDGLRRQDSYANQLSEEHGWCLDDTLVFIDKGRSGFHGHNLGPTGALTRFLELVKRGRISPGSVLIVENIDRLSRQDVDIAYDTFRGLLKAGIWIATKTPPRVYKRECNSFMDLMEPIWLMYLAHMESLKKSERISAAWDSARQAARTTGKPVGPPPPCWIIKTPTGFTLHPERSAAIRRACQLAREGYGYERICNILAKDRINSPGRSGRWTQSFIASTLRGRKLLGEYQPSRLVEGRRTLEGKPIPGYYPPLLTEEEWLTLQDCISRRVRKSGRPAAQQTNLFTGILFDADTGLPMAMHTCQNGTGQRYSYLTSRLPSGSVKVPYQATEACILDALDMLRPEDVIEPSASTGQRDQRIAALTARLIALDHRRQQLQAAAADPAEDFESNRQARSQIGAEIAATAKQLDTLKLEAISGRGEALSECQELRKHRDKAKSEEERQELDRRIKAALPSVVSSIWIKQQRVSIRHQIAHIQVWLRNGESRTSKLLPANLHGVTPWELDSTDLRRHIAHTTVQTTSP